MSALAWGPCYVKGTTISSRCCAHWPPLAVPKWCVRCTLGVPVALISGMKFKEPARFSSTPHVSVRQCSDKARAEDAVVHLWRSTYQLRVPPDARRLRLMDEKERALATVIGFCVRVVKIRRALCGAVVSSFSL
mmetsp:Transcript_26829/g.81195  ORF Transcript_26829/g.81195 Transcript_26829/m.81195 type:complete len:134 (-) Transcript_26829:151-552(-)|eukprot:scaffold167645_cov23-Tisochrysis_lutea.AAC.2